MKAALVLLFAMGVSSMTLYTDEHVPLITAMMGNMKDLLEDMKDIQEEMVKQTCQKSNKLFMGEDNPGADMESRTFTCQRTLVTRFQDCRMGCNALPTMGGRITCRNSNWWNYMSHCFRGNSYMNCPAYVNDNIMTTPPTPTTLIPTSAPSDMTSLNLVSSAAFTFTGSYFFTTNKMTRSAGKAFCEMNNGILAEPLLTDLQNIMGALNTIIGATKTRGYWLGAKRIAGTFRWENSGNRLPANAAQWFKKPDSGILCPFTNCQSDCTYITPETSVPVNSHLNAFLSCLSTLYPLCQTL